MVAHEEINARDSVRLESAPNFRDLGGLTTVDGRRVRPRMLFRSEGPAYFNEHDVARLRSVAWSFWLKYPGPSDRNSNRGRSRRPSVVVSPPKSRKFGAPSSLRLSRGLLASIP